MLFFCSADQLRLLINSLGVTDAKLKDLDEDNILGDVRRDIDLALTNRGYHGNKAGNKGGGYHANRNIGELRKELRDRELVGLLSLLAI